MFYVVVKIFHDTVMLPQAAATRFLHFYVLIVLKKAVCTNNVRVLLQISIHSLV